MATTTTTMDSKHDSKQDGKQDSKPFEESGPYDDEREVASLLAELGVRSDDERDESGPYDDEGEVAALLAELDGVSLARYFMARGPGDYQAEVLVDAADLDRVMRGPAWRLQRINYGGPGPDRFCVARGRGELLHRLVMEDELASWTGLDCAVVYHVNGDRLDNRRCNLRIMAQSEYRANANRVKSALPTSSRFKGVTLVNGRRWVARIRRQGRQVHLGTYRSEEDAARAYDDAARAEFGEFACLNYAREGERSTRRPPQAYT